MHFSDLGLSQKVLSAVTASGYTTPTPIQQEAIPYALAGRDVLGIAQTGTGKTAAFTLPMLSRLETGRARARMPRTLILEPTRELAAQVEEAFVKYGVNHKLSVALLIGGVSFADQEAKIMRGADVLIATPGRLLDFAERGKLLLTGIEILVIDEADRMLDMGFIPDIERICKLVPFTRQTLFFSATMPPEITRLTEQFLSNPARVEVAKAASTATTITQGLVKTRKEAGEKRDMLRRLVRGAKDLKNAIVFCNRKSDVAIVCKSLASHGFPVGALHGDMDQRARMVSLDLFKNGAVDLLVCSDVAARGLDIPDVSHVFNYDVPTHPEDYVHRIGRTGRAGRLGTAITLVTPADQKYVDSIEKLISRKIDWIEQPEGAAAEETASDAVAPTDDVRRSRRNGGSSRPRRASSENASQSPAQDEQTASTPPRAEPRLVRQHNERRPDPSRVEAAKQDAPRPESSGREQAGSDQAGRNQAGRKRNTGERGNRGQNGRNQSRQENSRQDSPSLEQPRKAREEQINRDQPRGDAARASSARPAPERRPRYEEDDRGVVGFGDHMPGFLMRPKGK